MAMMMKMMMIPLGGKIATSGLKEFILCTSAAPLPFLDYLIPVCYPLSFNRNSDITFGEVRI